MDYGLYNTGGLILLNKKGLYWNSAEINDLDFILIGLE